MLAAEGENAFVGNEEENVRSVIESLLELEGLSGGEFTLVEAASMSLPCKKSETNRRYSYGTVKLLEFGFELKLFVNEIIGF